MVEKLKDPMPDWLLDLTNDYINLLDLQNWKIYLSYRPLGDDQLGEYRSDATYYYAYISVNSALIEPSDNLEETIAHELGHLAMAQIDSLVLDFIIKRFIPSPVDQEHCAELYRFHREGIVERYARALVKARKGNNHELAGAIDPGQLSTDSKPDHQLTDSSPAFTWDDGVTEPFRELFDRIDSSDPGQEQLLKFDSDSGDEVWFNRC